MGDFEVPLVISSFGLCYPAHTIDPHVTAYLSIGYIGVTLVSLPRYHMVYL